LKDIVEVYGVLSNGLQIQLFMMMDFHKEVIVDRSETLYIGLMKNTENGNMLLEEIDLGIVVRILFFNWKQGSRIRTN
jgi:hypothetical protein